jgi:hypothetical protein
MANLINLTVNDTGFLGLPSGTLAQRPASPQTGYIRFNTTLGVTEYYNGTFWIDPATGRAAEGPIITTNTLFHVDAAKPSSYAKNRNLWYDISGNGRHFSLNGTTSFNASNDGSINFGDNAGYASIQSLNLQQNFTLEIWCFIIGNSAGLFGQGPTAVSQGLHVLWDATRGIVFGLYSNDLDTPSYGLTYGTWHQFAFTHNNSNAVKQFYADGVLINSHTGSAVYTGSGQFNIGSIYSSPVYANMRGRIAIARGYNTILSASDILQNFNAQRSRYNL